MLEIGCSYGGNLFPFAIANPQAKALGIDLSEVQINKAKELAAQMRVDNIEFKAKDICGSGFDWSEEQCEYGDSR